MEGPVQRVLLGCLLVMITTGAWAQNCVVADPTGTPLNVRARPNGAIVGALHNGTLVRILDMAVDGGGRPWAYVIPLGPGKRGWVFREFVICR
jgi:hypothetical protein